MEDKIPGLKAIKEGSRSATPSSDQNMRLATRSTDQFLFGNDFSDMAAVDDIGKDDADWNERAIGQKTWQRRQQSGEYDSASLSYSMKNAAKKPKKAKSTSEQGNC